MVRASFTRTSLDLNFGLKPATAAKKTTASAAVVAAAGEKSKR